jgi:protein TonB
MNMQAPLHVFDISPPTPLRRARPSPPLRSRVFAAVITIAAHIVAITAIIAGLRQANILHQPDVVTVQIDVTKQKPEDLSLPLPIPVMVRPSVITAPVPMFSVAPDPAVALPPAVPTASAAVPTPSAGRLTPSKAAVTWQGLLLARLQQAKHYPLSAQARRQQGVALLHFTMDRDGNVLTAEIRKSSGYDLLDQETMALVRRAQPLPRPPPEVTGNPVDLVVPVEFFLHNHR